MRKRTRLDNTHTTSVLANKIVVLTYSDMLMQLSDKNKKGFNEIFSLIDLKLSVANTEISMRPFWATCEFVEEFITEITGDTKEDYQTKEWFKELYKYSVDWYEERYGLALNSKSKEFFKGLILIYHTPFEIHIPKSLVKRDNDGIHKWITFPNEILPEEKIIDWIIDPPNLENYKESTDHILDQIKEVGTAIRSINIGLMTATSNNSNIIGMTSNIIDHLELAADDIVGNKTSGVSMAYWELQMAMEKILKVYLMQRGMKNPYNHKIKEMVKTSRNKFKMNIDDNLFENIPSDKKAIQYRYGEIHGTTSQYAFGVYRNVLQIVKSYTVQLKRNLTMHNASFQIAPPPWME